MPLTAVFVLWLRNTAPPLAALRGFAIALLVATQLILLPSEPYRRLMFEFGLLSWFHFYVAVCTSVAVIFMAWRPFSRRNLVLFGALCAALALLIGAQVIAGAGFLSGSFSVLDQIVEVRSPYALAQTIGPARRCRYYTWLLIAAPLLLAFYAYRVLREREPAHLYYAIAATFGLALLLDQFRLHYYGFFAMVTGGLLLLETLRARFQWHRGATFVAAFAAIAFAYQPALRERLFLSTLSGATPSTAISSRCSSSCRGSVRKIPASCSQAPTTATACFITATAASSPTISFSGRRTRATSTRSRGSCGSTRPRYGTNDRT